MPTTVKIDHEFKKEIDKLQTKVAMKTGEKNYLTRSISANNPTRFKT